MNVTQRQVALGLFGIVTVGSLLLFIGQVINGNNPTYLLGAGGAVLMFGALLFAYWRGWEYARYIAVILMALLVALSLQEPYLTQQITLAILIPPILALILAEPAWVIGSAIVLYVALLVRAGGQGVYVDPRTIVIFLMIIGGMILARLVTDTAHRLIKEHAGRAEESRAHAERQAQELAEANELMTEQLDQQSPLLDLVVTLETPVVPLAEGMLLAPLVGHMDSRRAEMLTKRLLQEASTQRARLVVLDIAGVSIVDTAVAKSLLQTVQALRLLGCEVILSGISASVAMALIHLGVSLEDVRTVRSPQEALAQYLGSAAVPSRSRAPLERQTSAPPPKTNGRLSNN